MTGEARAALDPDTGRVVGYAVRDDGAARVDFLLDGESVRRAIAVAPLSVLPDGMISARGAPPPAGCGFEMRLPHGAAGRRLVVRSDSAALLDVTWRSAQEMARYTEGSVMADSVTLDNLRLSAGVLRGRLADHARSAKAPRVRLFARGEDIGPCALSPDGDGVFVLSAALPVDVLGDGVTVLQLRLDDGSVIGSYPLAAGAALAGDLAAEVGSLRAELDQLKRAFRETFAGGVVRRDERPMIVAEALAQVDTLLEMRERMDRRQDALAADELLSDDEINWDVDQ